MVSELDKPEIYRKILESLQTGIYLVDHNQKILFWNDGAERITGHLRQDVLGRFCVAANMGKAAEDERAYYNVLRVLIISFMKGNAPSTAVEIGRRAIPGHARPDFQEIPRNS